MTCSGLHAPDFKGNCETRDCHLDEGIAEIVYALNDAGVATSSSCEGGGSPHGYLEKNVRYGWDDEAAGFAALRIALGKGMNVIELRKCWCPESIDQRQHFSWMLVFDRWQDWKRAARTTQ